MSAMREGSSDRYYQTDPRKIVPEGVEGRVPYRGPLSETIHQLVGGLRSGMGYLGAANLKELRERHASSEITNSALRESHRTQRFHHARTAQLLDGRRRVRKPHACRVAIGIGVLLLVLSGALLGVLGWLWHVWFPTYRPPVMSTLEAESAPLFASRRARPSRCASRR